MIRLIQETLTINELVKREGLYYKKFTNNPFNGEVLGKFSGKFRMHRVMVNGWFIIIMFNYGWKA